MVLYSWNPLPVTEINLIYTNIIWEDMLKYVKKNIQLFGDS